MKTACGVQWVSCASSLPLNYFTMSDLHLCRWTWTTVMCALKCVGAVPTNIWSWTTTTRGLAALCYLQTKTAAKIVFNWKSKWPDLLEVLLIILKKRPSFYIKQAETRTLAPAANFTQLQKFLGFAYFRRKFIRKYSTLAALLHALTSPRFKFEWCLPSSKWLKTINSNLLSRWMPLRLVWGQYSPRFPCG